MLVASARRPAAAKRQCLAGHNDTFIAHQEGGQLRALARRAEVATVTSRLTRLWKRGSAWVSVAKWVGWGRVPLRMVGQVVGSRIVTNSSALVG